MYKDDKLLTPQVCVTGGCNPGSHSRAARGVRESRDSNITGHVAAANCQIEEMET